jgi:integrase
MPKKQKKNQYKDGRFCARLDIGTVIENGKSKRKRIPFYSWVSLEDAEAKKLEYMRTHPKDADQEDRDATLGQWADKWLENYKKKKSDNTKSNYENNVRLIKRCEIKGKKLSDVKMTDIKHYQIQNLLDSLDGYSKSYIWLVYVTLKQIFRQAKKNHIITDLSAVEELDMPEGWYKGHRLLEEWEKELIYRNWREHPSGVWAMTMLYSGIRKGEMFEAKWDNANMPNKELSIDNAWDVPHNKMTTTKTPAGVRSIPIVKPLYEMLQELKSGVTEDYICLSKNGQHLTASSYNYGWKTYLAFLERVANDLKPYTKRYGDKGRQLMMEEFKKQGKEYREVRFTAHDLRYTFATMLYDANVDLKNGQRIMGHKHLKTLMEIYTQLSEIKKMQVAERLNSFFEGRDF